MSEVEMTQQINYKISSKHGGITLEDITIDQALTLTKTIVGTKGPYKVTISWEDDGIDEPESTEELTSEPEPKPEQEQELEPEPESPEPITSHINQTGFPQAADHITPKAPVIEPTPVQEPDPAQAQNINKYPPVKLLSTLEDRIDIDDLTTLKLVSIGANLQYGETEDNRLLIKYFATRIDTTWADLNNLEQTVPDPMPRGISLLSHGDTGNRRSAVIRFIEQMRKQGIKPGQVLEILYKLNHPARTTEPKENEDTHLSDSPQHKDPVIFKELDKIPKAKLAKYIDIDVFNMGYHDQRFGKIVICYGTTKVYTSWDDMFDLPTFIDNKSIEKLNNLKQVAIRHFRKWMAVHPDLLPDGVDLDAAFRSTGVGQSVYPPSSPARQDFGKGESDV
jgi:hypothetical protein